MDWFLYDDGTYVMKELKICENTMFMAVGRGFWRPIYRFADKNATKGFDETKKEYKSVIMLKICFRASDAFQQLLKRSILKLLHCMLIINLAQPGKRKNKVNCDCI